jgi:hypothetical protein
MKHRKLRIAWSVVWGVVAVLLVVLWVRSNAGIKEVECQLFKVAFFDVGSVQLALCSESGRLDIPAVILDFVSELASADT